nr:retrotransposon protein, putative, Ty3-gypsy subclass [Tanacetum cinerariifolium]
MHGMKCSLRKEDVNDVNLHGLDKELKITLIGLSALGAEPPCWHQHHHLHTITTTTTTSSSLPPHRTTILIIALQPLRHLSPPPSRPPHCHHHPIQPPPRDYDTNIQYHPGKANVVADALSRKSGMIAGIKVEEEIIRDLERLDIGLYVRGQHGYWASLRVKPGLISQIKEAQKDDSEIWTIVENLEEQTKFRLDEDDVLWQGTRLCVPNDATLRGTLLTEAHSSSFSVHSGSTKLYHDLKQHFWWSGIKRDVATFVLRCLICQRVKVEHHRASGLLQPLDIPVWKWDEISMDFVT